MVEVRSNSNVVWWCGYHVIWCTKYRRDLLTAEVGDRLVEIVHEVCDERGATVAEVTAADDHVRLLVTVDPRYGIHRLVKQIKGRSSRVLRQEFKPCRTRVQTLWTNSYFVATVGGAPPTAVEDYIADQGDV